MEKDNKFYSKIAKVPLLNGVKQGTIDAFLEDSRILSFNKDEEIFFQGGVAENFYIILDGYVKLFQIDIEGKEVIHNIRSTGDALLEIIVDDPTYVVNANTITKVTLLSVPLAKVCCFVRDNKIIASNMLSIIIDQYRKCISHFSQLSLKTVSQRVGWFLLKLFIENERNEIIDIPYDKRVVASYLGMKPETFSRIMKQLKDDEFIIQRNTVKVPKANSLCGYCDIWIAKKCPEYHAKKCPYMDHL